MRFPDDRYCGPSYSVAEVETERYVKNVNPTGVVLAVCREMGVTVSEVSGKCRHWRVVATRMVISHLLREHTTLSYPGIARVMGLTGHSTVFEARKRYLQTVGRDGMILFTACGREPMVVDIKPGYEAGMKVIEQCK